MTPEPLPPHALRRAADPSAFGFRTTAEIEPLERLVGQDRALDALDFGIAIAAPGFNVFILGDEGTGRRTSALDLLRRRAAAEPAPDEWCYVNDFDDPRRPKALRLPRGLGRSIAADLEALVTSLASELPRVLGSEEVQEERKVLLDRLEETRKELFRNAEEEAERRGLAVIQGPQAILLAPKVNGQIISDQQLGELPAEERRRYEDARTEVQKLFEEAVRAFAEAANRTQEALRALNRRATESTLALLLREIRERYAEVPALISYLDAMQRDLVSVVTKIGAMAEADPELLPRTIASEEFQRRYTINLLVSDEEGGAPVVEEPNPTFANLIGRIEHRVLQGVLTTDFTMIRAGSILRANGGYLLVDALELLRRPLAWEALKRALREGRLKIEEPGAELGLISTVSLDPEPIPLQLKVVLVGSPTLYYLLCALDRDFGRIFKVKSDFAPDIPRTPEAEREYARFIEACRRSDSLPAFDAEAVAALVEHGSRLAGDQTRLTARLSEIQDLVREAGFRTLQHAGDPSSVDGDTQPLVGRADVEAAIAAQRYRRNRLEEEMHRLIESGVLVFESRGTAVGIVNGLSVSAPGGHAFARPTRVSASAAPGSRGLIDIQRESRLGGPVHSKAVLILGGYLQQRYGGEHPLALDVTLGFEQVYAQVEGDSASLAELLAILSALSALPLRQDLAVTGSVDQSGRVQPVGAVTAKVEGFFHACRIQGLTGTQGVLLPARNVQHLMLENEVIAAVASGEFRVYPVGTVDQAIELAFDRPPDEVHQAVRSTLDRYITTWKELRPDASRPPQSPPPEPPE